MDEQQERDLRKTAERRADARLAFRTHVIVYAAVIGGLAAVNLMTSPGYLWFGWAAFGWGIGVLAHGLATFGYVGNQREKLVEQEIARMRAELMDRK